jgi:uncharacterized protein (TIGR02453 family)
MARFDGFPEEMLTFYEGLLADNSKAYWTDHRHLYDHCVAEPMRALLEELGPEFGEAKFFRPYRDVRFAKDKTPYKTAAAAVVHDAGGDGNGVLYVQVSADGLFVAGGYYHPASDQVQRLREAVADDVTGPALVRVLDELRLAGWSIGGEQLKRIPKPWDDAHPRAALLRHKALTAGRSEPPQEWLHTSEAKEWIADAWRQLRPLNEWLGRHVGVTRMPPRARSA